MSSGEDLNINPSSSRDDQFSPGASHNTQGTNNDGNDGENNPDSENLAVPSTSRETEVVPSSPTEERSVTFVDLPPQVLLKILMNFDFTEIAYLRSVCAALDRVGGVVLNWGFRELRTDVRNRFMELTPHVLKTEAANRYDRLTAQNHAIEKAHSKLKRLQKTFGKYIRRGKCCFFPAQILIEGRHLLHQLEVTSTLVDPEKVSERLCRMADRALIHMRNEIAPLLGIIEDSDSEKETSSEEEEDDDDTVYHNNNDPPDSPDNNNPPPLISVK